MAGLHSDVKIANLRHQVCSSISKPGYVRNSLKMPGNPGSDDTCL